MQPKLTIQERLKDLRVERGLTLEQLSAETSISKSALFTNTCLFRRSFFICSAMLPPAAFHRQ